MDKIRLRNNYLIILRSILVGLDIKLIFQLFLQDCAEFEKKCDKCQRFSDKKHAPTNEWTSVFSPWPFYKWVVDLVGPFPLAPRQLKFLIIGVDYFTKWVEAEAIAKITADRVKRFYWKKINCRFGLPRKIVSDNGTQFASPSTGDFCKHLGIQTKLLSLIHPQANGQAESANKEILNGIKKKLEAAKGHWAEQLHEVKAMTFLPFKKITTMNEHSFYFRNTVIKAYSSPQILC